MSPLRACTDHASSGIVRYMDLDRPATRPAVLTVDDDPEVLKAIERDLRHRYAKSYRILSANSGPGGARSAGSAARARRTGSAVAGRPSDAPDDRHRVPLPRRGTPARSQARPAHRLCRYRRRHPRHQRGQAALLSPQALGPARAKPVSGAGRSARRLEGILPAGLRRNARVGHALVAALLRVARISGAQPGAVPIPRRGDGRPGYGSPPGARSGRPR